LHFSEEFSRLVGICLFGFAALGDVSAVLLDLVVLKLFAMVLHIEGSLFLLGLRQFTDRGSSILD